MGKFDNTHKCSQNNTCNEVWPEITYWTGITMGPHLTMVGATPTSRFEHSETISFCPYCGADLRIGTGCGFDFSEEKEKR